MYTHTVSADEFRQFLHELYETFVDGPAFMTDEQRKIAASGIALSVVETGSPAISQLLDDVRRVRRTHNLPMGS